MKKPTSFQMLIITIAVGARSVLVSQFCGPIPSGARNIVFSRPLRWKISFQMTETTTQLITTGTK